MMLITYSHQHASQTQVGQSLENLCAISFFSLSPVWQQMGLPFLVTQTQKHDAAEQPVDKPGNQNPGEEDEASCSSVPCLMRWEPCFNLPERSFTVRRFIFIL